MKNYATPNMVYFTVFLTLLTSDPFKGISKPYLLQSVCVCVSLCVFVCVLVIESVCERERERVAQEKFYPQNNSAHKNTDPGQICF